MSSLIKFYGEFWNPDSVNWGSRGKGNHGKLEGKVKIDKKTETVDFWAGQGVYVLYDNFRPIYVGKSFSTKIGARIKDHLTDRLAGRWDMFSFYTTSNYLKGKKKIKRAGTRQLNQETIINTLEALAILIADPPLNRKRESLPSALEVEQLTSAHPHTIRHYLETILEKVEVSGK